MKCPICGQDVLPPKLRYCSDDCTKEGQRVSYRKYRKTQKGITAATRASDKYHKLTGT